MRRAPIIAAMLPLLGSAPALAASEAVIEEIVVTARFREETSQDVPLAITAFSAAEMERQQIETTYDLQYQTPGLSAARTAAGPTGATLTIRGQSASDSLLTTDSSVGVYVDGVSIPRFFGLNTALFDVERVEILKGPQGTLFGRNTTGGAVQFVTRKADYRGIHGFAELDGGRFDTLNYGAAVNVPLVDDKAALRLAAKAFTSDGWARSDGDGSRIDDADEAVLRGNLQIDPVERLSINLGAEYQEVDNESGPFIPVTHGAGLVSTNAMLEGLVPPDQVAVVGGQDYHDFTVGFDGGTTQPALDNYSRYERNAVTAAVTLDLDVVDIRSITGWHDFESNRSIDLDGGPTSGHQTVLDADAEFFSQELQLLGEALDDRLEWVLGAYFSDEEGTDRSQSFLAGTLGALLSPVGLPVSVFDGDVDNESWALFGQGVFQATDNLRFTLGYRYTEEDKGLVSHNRSTIGGADGVDIACNVPAGTLADCTFETSDQFDGDAWLISADYRFNDEVMVYVRAAEGFKGGGQNLRGSPAILTFSPVDPETATDVEVGVKSDLLDRRLRFNVAAYRTDYQDIQRSAIVGGVDGAATTIIRNAAEATIQGVELAATWAPVDQLTFVATGNYFDAEYDKWPDLVPDAGGDLVPIDRSPTPFTGSEWTYSLSARWDQALTFGLLSVTVDYYWQDDALLSADLNHALSPSDPSFQDPSLVTQDSYGLWNARTSLFLPQQGLEVAVFGKNLGDEEYLTSITDLSRTALGQIVGLSGAPRTWGVTLKKTFGGQ
jgi:iron complex outermembrane receptor protein